MGKWVLILLAAIIGLAILGALIDAARAVAWIAVVVLVIVLAVRWVAAKR